MENRTYSLPPFMDVLKSDYELIDKLRHALEIQTEFAARAELVSELVRVVSRVEDTHERVLSGLLSAGGSPRIAFDFERHLISMRQKLKPVYAAVHNTVPIDVYTPEPEGTERMVQDLLGELEQQLAFERSELFPTASTLVEFQSEDLARRYKKASHSALEYPIPPKSHAARMFLRFAEKLDHSITDTSEQYRPAGGLASIRDQ